MKVTVEIITGKYIDKELSDNATVRSLKEKIAAELNLAANRLILLVGESERRRIVMDHEDETLLMDLGVRDGSHMYLFFKHLDLVSREERSRGGGECVPMGDFLSEAEMQREEGGGGEDDENEAKGDEGEAKDGGGNEGDEKEVEARDYDEEEDDAEDSEEEDNDNENNQNP